MKGIVVTIGKIVVTIGKIAFRNEKIIHVKDKLDQLQQTIAASKRSEKV